MSLSRKFADFSRLFFVLCNAQALKRMTSRCGVMRKHTEHIHTGVLISSYPDQEGNKLGSMWGTRAISTISRRELSSSFFFFLQGKSPKEIHVILTEILACFLPDRAKDLSATQYACMYMYYVCVCVCVYIYIYIYETAHKRIIGVASHSFAPEVGIALYTRHGTRIFSAGRFSYLRRDKSLKTTPTKNLSPITELESTITDPL